jgi:hypothetical protein
LARLFNLAACFLNAEMKDFFAKLKPARVELFFAKFGKFLLFHSRA